MTLQIKLSNSNELTGQFSGRVLMLELHQKLSRFGDCFVFHRFVFGSCLLNSFTVSMYNKKTASVSKWNNCKHIAITIFNTEKSYQQTRRNVPSEISVHVCLGDLSTAKFSRGWPGSKVCSEHMNDWQYLSLGDLEQNEFFPKSKSWRFLVPFLTFNYGQVTCQVTKNWKWRKLAKWWWIDFVWMNKLALLRQAKHT